MLHTKTSIKINQPCQQNWNAMQGNTDGKFCSLCQKTVIDFTQLSDAQIHHTIKNASGTVCGRFFKHQVNRPLQIKEARHLLFGKFFLGISLATIFSNSLQALTKQMPAYYQSQIKKASDYHFFVSDSLRIIKVKLMDSATKESIGYANIVVSSLQQYATTDTSGIAQIKIPDSCRAKLIDIKAYFVGYKTQLCILDISKTSYVEMYLKNDFSGLSIVGGVTYEKQTLWTRIKNKFKRNK